MSHVEFRKEGPIACLKLNRPDKLNAITRSMLDDIAAHLRLIGELAGTTATAELAARRYESDLASLRDRYAAADPIKVFYQVAARPLFCRGLAHGLAPSLLPTPSPGA